MTCPTILAADVSSSAPTTNSAPPAPSTNAPPERRFEVRSYQVEGNTLLPTNSVDEIMSKHTGTNVALSDIMAAASELQLAYRNRGYITASVTLPQQQLTNGVVKVRVFEGRLTDIRVVKNRYFSTENVMRALPSLKTDIILNKFLFQAELDRANANQDRQIYPEIQPGPEPNTSALILSVNDRLPLHARVEVNNQSTPGTPDLRVDTSLTYNNLWQYEHSLGVQYSASPEQLKQGDQWSFYDRPLVANYSAYYRLPLTDFNSLAEEVVNRPGSFGYNEATHRFELPPSSGLPEFTIYGSRSTIDTGLTASPTSVVASNITEEVTRQDFQQDLTVNEAIGSRLTLPLPQFDGISSVASFGIDYKQYRLTSMATNQFIFIEHLFDDLGFPFDRTTPVPSPVPATFRSVDYLPFNLHWDANRRDSHGVTTFWFSYSPNWSVNWFESQTNFQAAAGSAKATGYYHILSASLTREQILYKDWSLVLHADGQWANQPLISNEQFGIGGIAGVRGYREGAQFGDTGWRTTAELKFPPYFMGYVDKTVPMSIRGSAFMDYGQTFLLDPNGRPGETSLWGAGFGAASSIGSHLQGRLMIAWPLLTTPNTKSGNPYVSFAASIQF